MGNGIHNGTHRKQDAMLFHRYNSRRAARRVGLAQDPSTRAWSHAGLLHNYQVREHQSLLWLSFNNLWRGANKEAQAKRAQLQNLKLEISKYRERSKYTA